MAVITCTLLTRMKTCTQFIPMFLSSPLSSCSISRRSNLYMKSNEGSLDVISDSILPFSRHPVSVNHFTVLHTLLFMILQFGLHTHCTFVPFSLSCFVPLTSPLSSSYFHRFTHWYVLLHLISFIWLYPKWVVVCHHLPRKSFIIRC